MKLHVVCLNPSLLWSTPLLASLVFCWWSPRNDLPIICFMGFNSRKEQQNVPVRTSNFSLIFPTKPTFWLCPSLSCLVKSLFLLLKSPIWLLQAPFWLLKFLCILPTFLFFLLVHLYLCWFQWLKTHPFGFRPRLRAPRSAGAGRRWWVLPRRASWSCARSWSTPDQRRRWGWKWVSLTHGGLTIVRWWLMMIEDC